MKIITVTVIALVLLSALWAVVPVSGETPQIKIVATLEIFATIAKDIGGQYVDADYIVPQGMDIHSYSLTYDDILKLNSADLVILASSEFFSIDAQIKEKLPAGNFLDMDDYNPTLMPLGNFDKNIHGYWLYPENAMGIAKAVKNKLIIMLPSEKSYFENRYASFLAELNRTVDIMHEIAYNSGITEKKVLLVVPGVFYVIKAMNVSVAGVILKGPEQFVSSSELSEFKSEIQRGEICAIINAEGMENTKAGEIATELSAETGVRVVYIDIFSADNYTALLLKDAVDIAGSQNTYVYWNGDSGYAVYYIAMAALSAVAAISIYTAWRYRRELLK